MGMTQLNRFLKAVKKQVGTNKDCHLVLGNESADLDSIISSLMYAYFLGSVGGTDESEVIPVVNAAAKEMPSRPEVTYLLSEAGIDSENLVFLEKIDLQHGSARSGMVITLVDHNELALSQQNLEDKVIGLIDHHADSGRFRHASPRIIEPVASTATLIGERILEHLPHVLDPGLAKLLLGPILLDSANLSPQAPQYHPKDFEIAQRLLEISGVAQTSFYRGLISARTNLSHLTAQELLSRDLKYGRNCEFSFGMSVVPIKLETWLAETPDLPSLITRFALDRQQDLFMVMTYYPSPKFERKIITWSSNSEILNDIYSYFNSSGAQLTPLERFPSDYKGSHNLRCWHQSNTKLSRKHLFPLLKSFWCT
jgi:exopolyphosphatase